MFPFRSLPPSFRFASSFPCVTSVLSFHVLYSVRYFSPFVSTLRVVSTLRFRSLRLSFRFTFPLLCVTSVRSFQVLYPVRFFFPFVSTLPCRLLRPSFWFNSSCVVSTFPFRSLRPFFHFKSPLPFKYFLSFVLTLMSCSFRFSFRFNSSFLFVASVPSYQLFCLARLALPFLSIRPFRCVHPFVSTLPSYLLFLSFRFNSSLLFVISFLSFQLSPHWYFTENLKKCCSREKHFFSSFHGCGHSGWYLLQVQATTCGHLRPLAATCPSGHLRPLAATCPSGHLRPLAATCGHLRPLAATRVAASGCKWLQVAANDANNASDAALEISNPTGWATGQLRPLAATRVAASGCKWLLFWISNTARFATSMKSFLFWRFLYSTLAEERYHILQQYASLLKDIYPSTETLVRGK